MPATQPVHVCILGAGIMGISTAYYLLHDSNLPPNSTVTLIDNVGIAPGASSRAAGFIAASWHPHTTLPLGELSFRLFEDLDKAHQGRARWEWRLLNAVGLHVGGKDEHMSAYRTLPVGETLDKLDRDWLQGERVSLQGGRTAAVDPGKFCQTLFDLCITKGLRFNLAEPLSLSPSTVTQQTILVQPLDSLDPISIPYTDLVLAAGPWTSALSTKLGLPALALTNVPGHSIILQPAPAGDANAAEDDVLPAEAVFAGIAGADAAVEASFKKAGRLSNEERARGFTPSPEFFTRICGEVWLGGENAVSSASVADGRPDVPGLDHRLPKNASQVMDLLDQTLIDRLLASSAASSTRLDVSKGAKLLRSQICYRPLSSDGVPMLGPFKSCGRKRVFVAVGHGPWGITLAPGTGKVLSEMILGQPLSADVGQLVVQEAHVQAKL